MTYHFAAIIPDRGIGILSDSVISARVDAGKWSKVDSQPKTFIISKYAVMSYAGDVKLGQETILNLLPNVTEDAVFDDIAPLIQKAFVDAAISQGINDVEFLLSAKTTTKKKKAKLIKYTLNKQTGRLLRHESQHHYILGLNLPGLEQEICSLLTENYKRTYKMELKMRDFMEKQKHIIPSLKSFPLGIMFGSLMPLIKDYIIENELWHVVGWPWTIVLLPEDGHMYFQNSEMYNGSKSINPNKI